MTLLCHKVMVCEEAYCSTANGSDIIELPPNICAVFKKRLKECADCKCPKRGGVVLRIITRLELKDLRNIRNN